MADGVVANPSYTKKNEAMRRANQSMLSCRSKNSVRPLLCTIASEGLQLYFYRWRPAVGRGAGLWISSGNNSCGEGRGWVGLSFECAFRGYTPYLPFFLKVLLGAGFEKNCPQNTSCKRVRGKLRETQELGAVVTWLGLPSVLRQ